MTSKKFDSKIIWCQNIWPPQKNVKKKNIKCFTSQLERSKFLIDSGNLIITKSIATTLYKANEKLVNNTKSSSSVIIP